MTFEQAIRDHYGVKVAVTPADLKLRNFRIDELRNGFLMRGDDCGIFGSIIDGECFSFCSGYVSFHQYEHQGHSTNKGIRHEWLIWEIARSALERGERLSSDDKERLALAVKRLEAWL